MTANNTNKPASPRQYCRRCGKTFKGHPTKKYCTGTCRQYAYLERHAMTVGEPLQNDNIDTSPPSSAMQEVDLQNEKGTMDKTTDQKSQAIHKAVNDKGHPQGFEGNGPFYECRSLEQDTAPGRSDDNSPFSGMNPGNNVNFFSNFQIIQKGN